jgi:hypothetical protein
MTDTEVLLAAADLIERNGLHKGEEWPGADRGEEWHPGDPCCVLGAIALVDWRFPGSCSSEKAKSSRRRWREHVERRQHPGAGSRDPESSSDV